MLTSRDDDRRLAVQTISSPRPRRFATTLPESGDRRGLLGQASLNLNAHSTSTSATLRGNIRQKILCQVIPPPPANVDTSIPEADESHQPARTNHYIWKTQAVQAVTH